MNTSKTADSPVTHSRFNLRQGMHLDLVGYFEIPDETSESGATLVDFIDEAVCGDTIEARISAAKAALEAAKGPCGLAYIVLAREGSSSLEEALEFANKAVADLKQEVLALPPTEKGGRVIANASADDDSDETKRFDRYESSSELYTVAILDLAQLMWQAGMRSEALTLVKTERENEALEFYSINKDDLRDAAISFMIQEGDIKGAQEYLHNHADGEAQWSYLNALLRFLTTGDSLISRSALGFAFSRGTIAAHRLVEGNVSTFNAQLDKWGMDQFIVSTEPAWQASAGAIEWLTKIVNDPLNFANREMDGIAAANNDLKRWKRWEDLLETAHHFSAQENYKEARTALKTALREAERIEYSFLPFHACLCELLDLHIDSKRPADELLESINARGKHFESGPGKTNAMLPLHLSSIASLYEFFEEFEKSSHYHEKAVQAAELQQLSNDSFLTLFDLADMRNDMAYVLYKLEKYDEAMPIFLKNAEIEESFLCTKHPEVLESLEQAYYCANKLDDAKARASILERIKEIDANWEEDHEHDSIPDHDHSAPGHSCGHDHH